MVFSVFIQITIQNHARCWKALQLEVCLQSNRNLTANDSNSSFCCHGEMSLMTPEESNGSSLSCSGDAKSRGGVGGRTYQDTGTLKEPDIFLCAFFEEDMDNEDIGGQGVRNGTRTSSKYVASAVTVRAAKHDSTKTSKLCWT